jgi:hypothetical protein
LSFWSAAALGAFFLLGSGAESQGAALLLGVALRSAIVLHLFSFLDAYFTAREINSGVDRYNTENPRVAAVLNLVTRGFGYWYVGERKKGFIVFFLLGIWGRIGTSAAEPAATVFGLIEEFVLAAIAIDAYRIAARQFRDRVAVMHKPVAAIQPDSGIGSAIPVALAIVFAAAYIGLILIGIMMPSYDSIDQSAATITSNGDRNLYSNPSYGLELQVPIDWSLDHSDEAYFVQASLDQLGCQLGLMAIAGFPFRSLESEIAAFVDQFVQSQPDFRMKETRSGVLGGLPSREVVFEARLGDSNLSIEYLFARRGLTTYMLFSTFAASSADACREGPNTIRTTLVLK